MSESKYKLILHYLGEETPRVEDTGLFTYKSAKHEAKRLLGSRKKLWKVIVGKVVPSGLEHRLTYKTR